MWSIYVWLGWQGNWMGERIIFSCRIKGTETTGYPHLRDEVGPLCYIIYTINTNWTTNLNVKDKTRKLLEKNIGANLQDLWLGIGFLNMTPKTQIMKKKLDKLVSST